MNADKTRRVIPVRIEFEHTKAASKGRLVACSDGRRIWEYVWPHVPKEKSQFSKLGWLADAERIHAEKRFRFWKSDGVQWKDIKTEADFEQFTLGAVRVFMLYHVTQINEVLAPTNFVEHFWQPAFLCKLAKKLGRKFNQKHAALRQIESMLNESWRTKGLDNMDRYQLAEWVKPFCGTFGIPPMSAAAIWTLATGTLGLYSQRNPGPRRRQQINLGPDF